MSSFFDDTKNAGLLLLIIAIIQIAFSVIVVFAFDDYKNAEMWKKILYLVGMILSALIFGILGLDIKGGSCRIQIGGFFSDVTSKFGVLVAITAAMGFTNIISGVFSLVAFGGMDVFTIIVGVLLIVMAYLMISGGELAGNVIWIILLIIYIIGIIVSAIASLVLVGIPSLLLFILLLTFLLSPEVKQKMGM